MGALLRLEEEGPEVENVYLSAMGRTQFVLVVLWLSLTLCVWLKGASGSSIRPGTDSRGVQEAAQLTMVGGQGANRLLPELEAGRAGQPSLSLRTGTASRSVMADRHSFTPDTCSTQTGIDN